MANGKWQVKTELAHLGNKVGGPPSRLGCRHRETYGPAVGGVIIVACGEAGGAGRRLVAYVVLWGEAPPPVRELRDFLAEILPEHMVPSEERRGKAKRVF